MLQWTLQAHSEPNHHLHRCSLLPDSWSCDMAENAEASNSCKNAACEHMVSCFTTAFQSDNISSSDYQKILILITAHVDNPVLTA